MDNTILTERQQEAVTSPAQWTLVIAGAGSGKTGVLARRVVCLVTTRGVSPSDILCVTFTRKAAGEMRQRIERMLGGEKAALDMTIGTFHSVALAWLRADGGILGYVRGNELTVIDPDDADMLLRDVCADMGYAEQKADKWCWHKGLSWRKVQRARDYHYTQMVDADGMGRLTTPILAEYKSRLFSMNMVDFGGILCETRRMFRHDPRFGERYRKRFPHVLVDEVQDCNAVQWDLIDVFAAVGESTRATPSTLFAVGDTRQSIYGFRGARPDLLITHYHDATERPHLVNLEDCFRCGPRIVSAANALIAHNDQDLHEPMRATSDARDECYAETGRSANIAQHILHCRGLGYAWSDIAVLARSHRILRRLEDVFKAYGIPSYRVGNAFDVCRHPRFLITLAGMRLLVNPDDNLAFMRLADSVFGLSREEVATIRSEAATRMISGYAKAWRTLVDEERLATRHTLQVFASRWDDDERHGQETLEDVFGDDSDYEHERAFFYRWHKPTTTVRAALDWLAIRDSQEDMETGNRVTLCTAHAAKGLEWPFVVCVAWNEGTWPSSQAIREDGIEEERRLAYVALTRASERAMIHYRRNCDQSDAGKKSPPSRFVAESGL